ncbi:hypothetical protein QT381_02620 [Galbitalea sp. SE-J8]|uniref:hypothetical protein n=1 Tax=Galbitalea sp. SE-J8 TaxID=3054952 RepID=UPI00259CBE45|nr:hypothetical protein [Galbitalea sp. SE-J8]MDM4761897.1 hypothetical protein [Galbitalea sp. SE-J8]
MSTHCIDTIQGREVVNPIRVIGNKTLVSRFRSNGRVYRDTVLTSRIYTLETVTDEYTIATSTGAVIAQVRRIEVAA